MDSTPIFPGFGRQLSAILTLLDSDLILDPVWSLKQTNEKIFLDIVWTRIKTPATGAKEKATNCVTQKKLLDAKQVDQRPVNKIEVQCSATSANGPPAVKKKKVKSPSTRRRDKERFAKWLSQKQGSTTSNGHKCTSDSTRPPFMGTTECISDLALESPAMSISHGASVQEERKGVANKLRHDAAIQENSLCVGDRVLVKNVTIRGKHKLANRWEDTICVISNKPDDDSPVYTVTPENEDGPQRTLHRNMLLPCRFPTPVLKEARQPSPPPHRVTRAHQQTAPTFDWQDSDEECDIIFVRHPPHHNQPPEPSKESLPSLSANKSPIIPTEQPIAAQPTVSTRTVTHDLPAPVASPNVSRTVTPELPAALPDVGRLDLPEPERTIVDQQDPEESAETSLIMTDPPPHIKTPSQPDERIENSSNSDSESIHELLHAPARSDTQQQPPSRPVRTKQAPKRLEYFAPGESFLTASTNATSPPDRTIQIKMLDILQTMLKM